jgi:HEAT repeat protein
LTPAATVAALLAQAGHRDKNVRTRIAFELGRLTDAKARDAIYDARLSDDWAKRFAAVRAIKEWSDDPRRSAANLRSVLDDPVTAVRWAAVRAVAQRDRVDAVGPLALNDPAPTVREAAVRALWKTNDTSIAIQCLTDDDQRVRFAAVVLLRDHGDATARDLLIRALDDRAMWIRAQAIDGLTRIRGAEVAPAIIPLLRDRKQRIRWEAARALGEIGDPRAVEPLLDLLARSTRPFGKGAAIVGLSHLGDRRAVEPIVTALRAAWVTDPRSGEGLLLGEEDWQARQEFELRRDATKALLRLGGERAESELARLPAEWVSWIKHANLF